MILWNKNIEIDDNLSDIIFNTVKKDQFFDKEHELYTTFYERDVVYVQQITEYYSDIITQFMTELTLYHRSLYNWSYWFQLYNSNTLGHNAHDHFDGFSILSWVHFINIPKQKCFYFLDSKENKHYPEFQNKNDFIVFPSWALHGVDRVIEKDFNRLICSGNIGITYINTDCTVLKSVQLDRCTTWLHER